MIVTNIIGGLGNQMFQYAAARALSLRKNTELILDVSGFENYALHQGFELDRIFNCLDGANGAVSVRANFGGVYSPLARRLLSRRQLSFIRPKKLIYEPHFQYWPGIASVADDCYLTGYWQSEKYFQQYSNEIRRDFSFKPPLSDINFAISEQIENVNSISLHVRRGDYVNDPTTTSVHGVCSLDYYKSAIDYMVDRVDNPHFFLFSDDINWVKENLKINFPHTFVNHNTGAESYNDMRLMSLCDNHIIANSSFSWWGAWLNPIQTKVVIAPKYWFRNGNDVTDLFPPSWVTL